LLSRIKTATDAEYLYALNNKPDGEIAYVAEGLKPNDNPEDICELGYVEDAGEFSSATFSTLETGKPQKDKKATPSAYGILISGYAPIITSDGRTVGVVGSDVNVSEVLKDLKNFLIILLSGSALIAVVFAVISVKHLHRVIAYPLDTFAKVANSVSNGDNTVNVPYITTNDEIGLLAHSLRRMQYFAREQTKVLTTIANSDYTVNIPLRSSRDEVGKSIKKILENNCSIIGEINDSASNVKQFSEQLENGTSIISNNASSQTATVSELLELSNEITRLNEENNEKMNETVEIFNKSNENAQDVYDLMEKLLVTAKEIGGASRNIASVIQSIDGIAFQTNILALNASVEAARAGNHGKAGISTRAAKSGVGYKQ
jgi:methyl-accepting chemotaxis protein